MSAGALGVAAGAALTRAGAVGVGAGEALASAGAVGVAAEAALTRAEAVRGGCWSGMDERRSREGSMPLARLGRAGDA